MPEPQNYKSHGRIVPAYIGGLLSLFAYLIWSAYHFYQVSTLESAMGLLLATVLIVMFVSVRGQILRVQDRLIRLEMRLRMRELLPADLAARASEIPIKQLVALRFASDAELPELASDVVAGNVTEPKQIKLKIKQWQADHLRA